jgi:hypothetical protein
MKILDWMRGLLVRLGLHPKIMRQVVTGPAAPASPAEFPVNTSVPRFDNSAVSGSAVTAPIVGQVLYYNPRTWDGVPTSYAGQFYKDGVASGSTITWNVGDPVPSYTVDDTDLGVVLRLGVIASNLTGDSTEALSVATSAVAAIDLTSAITAFTRTSSSTVTPMTWDLTLAANVYEGYTLRAQVFSDSALTTETQNIAHILTGPDLVAAATIDLTSDGLTAPGTTDWLQLSVEATSPHGIFYSYTYPTPISPTDVAGGHTYWRLYATADNGGSGLAARDIELALAPAGANIATSATLTASSNFGGSFDIARVADGNTGTIGATDLSSAAPYWIRFQFGSPQDVHQLIYRSWTNAGATPNTFKIQSSDDGATWADESSQSGITWTSDEVKTWTW